MIEASETPDEITNGVLSPLTLWLHFSALFTQPSIRTMASFVSKNLVNKYMILKFWEWGIEESEGLRY